MGGMQNVEGLTQLSWNSSWDAGGCSNDSGVTIASKPLNGAANKLQSFEYPLNSGQQESFSYMTTSTFQPPCDPVEWKPTEGPAMHKLVDALNMVEAVKNPVAVPQGSAMALAAGIVDFTVAGLPVRPGTKACDYYLRTGNCKYGGTCIWNHPPNMIVGINKSFLNSLGYPLNHGQQACSFYMQTGFCKQGVTCQHAHPELSPSAVTPKPLMEAAELDRSMDLPSRPGNQPCGHFLKTGTCKFGSTCRFDHPTGNDDPQLLAIAQSLSSRNTVNGFSATINATSDDLPLRPGATPCSFYLRTGQCAFGARCKFDHPTGLGASQAGTLGVPTAADGSPLSSQGLPLRPGGVPCSNFLKSGTCKFGPSCMFDHPEGLGGTVEDGQGSSELSGLEEAMKSINPGTAPDGSPLNILGLPIRPGKQQCSFFLKTGTCKFGAKCIFDHPEGCGGTQGVEMNSLGFPMRPGGTICAFYMRTGQCKFGSSCKHDHPELNLAGSKDMSTDCLQDPTNFDFSKLSQTKLEKLASLSAEDLEGLDLSALISEGEAA